MRTVYLNGHFVPESDAKLSIYDLSVMQAAAAFEMTRSFNGKHFKLWEHLLRLQQSCELLGILLNWPPDSSTTALEEICLEVSSRNDHGPGEEHRLLIVVSPGAAPIYKDIEGTINHPFVYIADFPLRYTVAGFSKYFTEGVHCVTSDVQQVPDACVPSRAKHRSRLHFHLAQMRAPVGTWPLMMGERGYYCEAPGANLMWVSGGQVYGQGIDALEGISMRTVMDITGAGFLSLHKQTVPDELWLTGTPFFALSVVSLDGKPIGDGKIGPVYKAMMEKADALVGLCIKDQIIRWDEEADT